MVTRIIFKAGNPKEVVLESSAWDGFTDPRLVNSQGERLGVRDDFLDGAVVYSTQTEREPTHLRNQRRLGRTLGLPHVASISHRFKH